MARVLSRFPARAAGGGELDEFGGFADRQVALARQVHGTISRTRPGSAAITSTRWPRKAASWMLCVTNRTVTPVSCQTRSSSSFRRSRVISSSAPKGSSISRIFGSLTSARAIETRWRWPPDSSCG
jgi:hypothetical protein